MRSEQKGARCGQAGVPLGRSLAHAGFCTPRSGCSHGGGRGRRGRSEYWAIYRIGSSITSAAAPELKSLRSFVSS